MASNAIEVERLSKRYRLGEYQPGRSVREAVGSLVRAFRPRQLDEIWSLRDVTFSVPEGDAVGVVGRNGAGKTTLLKILSRITEPTSGVARTRGRVAALLEVGTGFHPELTGRENVYLNGAILGMGRRAIDRRFDEIVAFAAMERFIDTPIKRYSTGMYLRLAFSVAAHLEPDILVVDEVLAVGDAEFQAKCLGRMSVAEREGRTVMFVSHNLDAIVRLCPTAMWLDRGSIQKLGPSAEVVEAYLSSGVAAPEDSFATDAGGPVTLRAVRVTNEAGEPVAVVRRERALVVEVTFSVGTMIPSLDLAISLANMRGVEVLNEAWSDESDTRVTRTGTYVARVQIPPVLNVGEYIVGVWLGTALDTFVHETAARRFRVEGDARGRPNRAVALGLQWQVQEVSDATPGQMVTRKR